MEFKVSTEHGVRPITVIQVEGNIDSASYQEFQSKAEALVTAGSRDILIDLTKVHFVSSAGIRAIHSLFNKLRTYSPDISDEEMRKGINAGTYKSPHLKLLNPSKETATTFEMTGLDMYINIYTDRKKALSSY
jgi:anti-anti-sigma factor